LAKFVSGQAGVCGADWLHYLTAGRLSNWPVCLSYRKDSGFRDGADTKRAVNVSGPAFTDALQRYTRLRSLEFSRLNFAGLPAIQLRRLVMLAWLR
jgi:hypothetical protein